MLFFAYFEISIRPGLALAESPVRAKSIVREMPQLFYQINLEFQHDVVNGRKFLDLANISPLWLVPVKIAILMDAASNRVLMGNHCPVNVVLFPKPPSLMFNRSSDEPYHEC
jgi:hypothetical protein